MNMVFVFNFLFLLFIFCLSFRIIRENERIVIFRLGQFLKIAGPGLVLTIPFLDKIQKIDLDKTIPNWKEISTDLLHDKIRKYAFSQIK